MDNNTDSGENSAINPTNIDISTISQDSLFTIKIEEFEGPLDLLLHLVKKNELELEKVSLALVAEQYMACLKDIEHIDIELASEYLVIAATLLSIKSSILLDEPVELVLDEDGNLVNPHDLLLQRLKEAEIYKDGSAFLEMRNELGFDVFATKPSLSRLPAVDAPLKEHDALLLGKAFKRLVAEMDGGKNFYHVTLESVSVAESMAAVLDRLSNAPASQLSFEELLGKDYSKGELIGVFISLLELCKRLVIKVRQQDDTISVALATEEFSMDDMTSEFDEPEVMNQ